jgi:hypothetical protein
MKLKITKRMMVGMIGIDYDELKKTSERNVDRFFLAAVCVIAILILSFISVYYAFELMFHMWYVQILLSLFFSLMFGVIYVLLIQTFSKQPLAQKRRYRLNISNILRGSFILFIGFLISKPIEIIALSSPLHKDIENYRKALNTSFDKQIRAIYASDINKLKSRQTVYQQLVPSGSENYFDKLSTQIADLEMQEQTAINKAHIRIDQSSFFLQRVRLATGRYRSSWIICIIIITLFFIPAMLVYTISSNNEYYISKGLAEHALVLSHYLHFRKLYTEIFADHFRLKNIEFYESHSDPPFRTELIAAPHCNNEKDFFNRFRGYGLPQRLL